MLNVGVIGPAHGLRGEAIIDVRTDEPEKRLQVGKTVPTARGDHLTVRSLRTAKNRWIIGFAEVTTREEIEALRGLTLVVDPQQEEKGEDEFYLEDLKGLDVLDTKNQKIGTIVDLEFGVAQDRIVVKTATGKYPVPFVKALVPHVDLAAGTVTVDAPEGLLEG
ncbi:MAG: ribosome maturation factor RimM [Actinomycetaceae bacterium]|nr:ribosome maturation factor RimM [Actinomycetaceae bacterium]